jgi:hypothetical protein
VRISDAVSGKNRGGNQLYPTSDRNPLPRNSIAGHNGNRFILVNTVTKIRPRKI